MAVVIAALLPVFAWTLIFAASTVFINALAGLVLGILLNNKNLKFRGVYRTLLFLPWAIPTVISIPMWGALMNQQFGIVNRALGLLGSNPVPWLTDGLWIKIAILLVNLWLGFPYMMTATLAALATIPEDIYEAADIDGASAWQKTRSITLPLLRNAFTPILLSGFAFNFNNFNIIYMLTGGGPRFADAATNIGATDLLITVVYKTAFSGVGRDYGLASALSIVIFLIVATISAISFRQTKALEEIDK